ncbi:DUF5125 domain-containing protein [Sphingobacterium sp. LRF_L2]|uniref:DUF5125 domain-containing protein n=1 Tax=Sphingobacterium sp. LRF_L2 TaxID=3369421 RepID=UPI003F5EAFA7
MEKIVKFLGFMLVSAMFFACKQDYKYSLGGGHPMLNINELPSSAYFGDSIAFDMAVADDGTELSTLKVQLYFSGDLVSEKTIRTKTYGNYSGKIYIPFLKDVPDGTAQLRFVLENVGMVKVEEQRDLVLSRPDFPYLNLVTSTETIRLDKIGTHEYAAEGEFPQKVKAYIEAPAFGEHGNVLHFGWQDGHIVEGSTEQIPFSYLSTGSYTISFNTLSYMASPFQSYKVNDVEMQMVDDSHYAANVSLVNGQEIALTGIPDLESWWLDSDFIRKDGDKFIFDAADGRYKITADFDYKYFVVEVLNGDNLATLNADGTGAIWIIGQGVGKPGLSNEVGWTTEKALCLAPIGNKKYRITLVAGQQIKTTDINFKFFHQKGWGGEFKNDALTTGSDLIFIGDGTNNRDAGNLGILAGKQLQNGMSYIFTIDVSAGIDKAILAVDLK